MRATFNFSGVFKHGAEVNESILVFDSRTILLQWIKKV